MKHVWYKELPGGSCVFEGIGTKINPIKKPCKNAGLQGLSPLTKLSLAKLPAGIALLRFA